jgi:6-phosphogluconolactonase (cycloisomerase 2 family)/uncharacterized protein YjdB
MSGGACVKSLRFVCVSILALASVLLCVGRVAADPSGLTVSPGSLNFGKQDIGITSGAGAVGLTNHLSYGVSFTMAITKDFSAVNNCGGVLEPGETCTIKVYFTPSVLGGETGNLLLDVNLGNGQGVGLPVSLSGTGTLDGFSSIVLTPANPSVALGLPEPFTALGYYTNGSVVPLTDSVNWTSSNLAVATISNAAGTQGQIHTVAQGVTTIAATLGSYTGSTTLTVTPPLLKSISLTPLNPTIALGTKEHFDATGTYTDGSTRDVTSIVAWSSSAPSVATVAVGLATSLVQGVTTITASFSGPFSGSASTVLTVGPPALTSLVVTPSNARIVLTIGSQSQQFTATGTYTDGSTKDLTSSATWASSDTNVATVSAGLAAVTEKSIGTPAISASVDSIHASATLTVVGIISVTVTPSTLVLPAGETAQLTATANLSDGTTMDVTKQAEWYSTYPSANVSDQGLVTAVSPDSTGNVIKAIVGNAYYPHIHTGSATVFVGPAVVTGITLSPPSAALRTGTSQQFTATGTYSDGTQQDFTSQVAWTSSDPTVATAAAGGVVGGVAPGTATITALLTGPGLPTSGISGSAPVTVSGQLISIAVSPATATIPLGNTEQFSAAGTYADGTTSTLTAATWSSSDTGVATVTGGLATSTGQGSATISATVGSTGGSAGLTVTAPALVSINITPAHSSIQTGTTEQLTATGNYTDKSTQDLTGSVTWSSSNVSAAPVASGGLVTAAAVGVTSVTATSGQVSGSTPLGVAVPGQARFAYITDLNANSVSICLVDNSNGALVPIGTVSTGQDYPLEAVAGPAGKFLYVGTKPFGKLYTYAIDSLTGSLQLVSGSPVYITYPGIVFSGGLAMHPSGKYIYPAGSPLGAYSLDSNGIPTLLTTVNTNYSLSVALDPTGKYLYAASPNTITPSTSGNTLSVFSIDPATGVPTEISGSPFTINEVDPALAAVYPLGGYLFLSDQNGYAVSVFPLDATTGAISGASTDYPISHGNPGKAVFDPAGKFVFVPTGTPDIFAFTVDSATGALTPVPGSPFIASGLSSVDGFVSAVVDPTGRFLYAPNYDGSQVFTFSIDPTTGALTQVSTITTPLGPSSINLVK